MEQGAAANLGIPILLRGCCQSPVPGPRGNGRQVKWLGAWHCEVWAWCTSSVRRQLCALDPPSSLSVGSWHGAQGVGSHWIFVLLNKEGEQVTGSACSGICLGIKIICIFSASYQHSCFDLTLPYCVSVGVLLTEFHSSLCPLCLLLRPLIPQIQILLHNWDNSQSPSNILLIFLAMLPLHWWHNDADNNDNSSRTII